MDLDISDRRMAGELQATGAGVLLPEFVVGMKNERSDVVRSEGISVKGVLFDQALQQHVDAQ